MEKEKKEINDGVNIPWYDNPSVITNLIIGLIAVIIILSQSFAINNNLSTHEILSSIINHNSVYLIALVYFVALKTNIGKRYFDFLNIFLVLLYFITGITAFLTIFQSFSLETIVSCALHLTLFVYLFHTLFRRTRVWKEFHLDKSPFNEIKNDAYFYAIVVLTVVFLALDLIVTTTPDGAILSILDACYMLAFARYVFLYGCFVDNKERKINVTTTMDEVKEAVDHVADAIENAVDNVTDTISDAIDNVSSAVEKAEDKKKSTKKTIKKSTKKSAKKGEDK